MKKKERMNEVFLGLGGNIGQRQAILNNAVNMIGEVIGPVIKKSSLYETAAWGTESENQYLNQVVQVETSLTVEQVLAEISRIETQLGRKRTGDRNADRLIDIDILFYNTTVLNTKNLEVPHPRMHLRKFVLIPICEIAGNFVHPVFNKELFALLLDCPDTLAVKKFRAE